MSLLSYFFPQTLLQTSSKYNRMIRVNEEFGKPKLLVNGSRQSGEYIKKLWEAAFKAFGIGKSEKRTILPALEGSSFNTKILVLGVAGGTVIHLLHAIYPEAKITAVDIDKKMIDIGSKYFGLGELKNLKIVEDDAKVYVDKQKNKFDLIVVDLFSGRKIPEFVASLFFLKNLRALLTKNGTVVINYLRELEYQEKSEQLAEKLRQIFAKVTDFEIERNRFFCASQG